MQVAPAVPMANTGAALQPGRREGPNPGSEAAPPRPGGEPRAEGNGGPDRRGTGASPAALSSAEQRQVQQLKQRDQEVRAHERAHVAAGGGLVRGGANFSYQVGPDGRRYAVGGEVSIDTSPVPGDPQATIAKAQQIRRAALAPAEPSTQDRRVAAAASAMEQQARAELLAQRAEEGPGGPPEVSGGAPPSAATDTRRPDSPFLDALNPRQAGGLMDAYA